MKNLKVLALVLALVMVLSALAGCGNKTENNGGGNDTTQNEQVDNNSSSGATDGKIVNEDGDAFIVPTENKGTIKEGVSVNTNEVTISGKTYTFPVKVSDMLKDGWHLSENLQFDNEFEAKKSTSLISFDFYHEDGSEISLNYIYNDTDKVQKFEDCILTGFDITTYNDVDFVFPGGITNKSTAADVLAVYGDPNKTTEFDSGYSLEKQLTYVGNNKTDFRISYTFNEEDGTIYSASIEIED